MSKRVQLQLCGIVLITIATSCKSAPVQQAKCPEIDMTAEWVRVNRAWSDERGLQWSNDSLRTVLLTLRDRDQAARADFGARAGDSTYARQLMRLDSAITAEMDVILEKSGLPTRSLVGAQGADAAMLIVQHSATLQKRVLALAKALPAGEVSAEKLAMLEDRILMHQGKPQIFGSQFNLAPGGSFQFAPVVDAANLDARRSAAGMMPMRAYVCMMEEAGMRIDRASLPAEFRR
jgi:hypothetical protein